MSAYEPTAVLVEPTVGILRVVKGVRVEDVACPLMSMSPAGSPREREGERLFVLMSLAGQAPPHVYLELREVLLQAYWTTDGSVTAALRSAVAAANRRLYQGNLRSEPAQRSYGSIACAVLSGEDLFILQAGAVCVCVSHGNRPAILSVDEQVPALGIGPVARVRLSHATIGRGDILLMSSPAVAPERDDEIVSELLGRATVDGILEELLSLGSAVDLVALVASWAGQQEAPAIDRAVARPVPRPVIERPLPVPEPLLAEAAVEVAEPRPGPQPPPRKAEKPAAALEPVRKPGPGLGERLGRVATAIGKGIVSIGPLASGAAKHLLIRLLPGAEHRTRARARPVRRVPKENRAVMMAIAFLLPVVMVTVIVLAYRELGLEARFATFVRQAQDESVLAAAAGGGSDTARVHWTAVLSYTARAAALKPQDPTVASLHAQARTALDQLDRITRLNPVLLYDFGIGTEPRQLVVHGQMVFVLDPAAGWVAQVTVNQTGNGVDDNGVIPILVQSGQRIGGMAVGSLLDLAWVDAESGRRTSGLLMLEENSAVVSYDPAWGTEEGAPQLMRFLLSTPPIGLARSVGSYGGRLYILDPEANQIWRYAPEGDVYSQPPERYFETDPAVSLATAVDMAIDGNIYVLCANGVLYKFFGGERRPFEVRDQPGDLTQAVALAADPDGNSDVIYVADRGTDYCDGRVVALSLDGAFRAQFCAEGAFDSLEALAFDRAMRRLYVISGGRLYVASLP